MTPVTLPRPWPTSSATTTPCPGRSPRPRRSGPFTLFLADEGTGWEFYARPRLGLDQPVTADDVRRVFDRQVELDKPRTMEWVDETTPTLLPAVRNALGSAASAGAHVELEQCPLLVLPTDAAVAPSATGARPGC